MKLVFLGAPGVGKGTAARYLEEKYNVKQISTGDLIREEIAKQTTLGKEIEGIVKKGNLVSDEIVAKLVEGFVKKHNSFVLDGFPRTIKQAELLEEIEKNTGKKIDAVLYFTAPEQTIIERLTNRRVCPKCGRIYNLKTMPPKNDELCDYDNEKLIQRPDDREEVVKERLRVYAKKTAPLVDYYKKKGLLIEVDFSGNVEENYAELEKALKKAGLL
ncbi:MAG: adenylate kinase [Candidatus Diapherotrites archaeon]|nr:adenylate kinase [Candidatus Diapherotrites archaeon]